MLGPTLFLIYVNDLGMMALHNGKIISFADDTALLFSVGTWQEVLTSAQSRLNVLTKWLLNNVLTLNTDKTKCITFNINKENFRQIRIESWPTHGLDVTIVPAIALPLESVENLKYLGIVLTATSDSILIFTP